MSSNALRHAASFLLFSTLVLTGCGISNTSTPTAITPPVATKIGAIQGTVHGGQQAITAAHVYLLAAGVNGYNGASTSLLNAATTGTSDSVGAYVLTDANGGFNITGAYTCTAGTQVYMYALGGNPGSGTNTASGLLAVLGNCPASGTLAAQTPSVVINEVSTIAAAYAIAGFARDATHVSSSGSTLAQAGIANAFTNAAQMNNIADPNGARTTTPGGNGTVPRALIHTLANILAACINSTSSTSGPCTTLLSNSKNSAGNAPSDTATAAINIAHSPAANVANLYMLATATSPFQPQLSAQPNDFSITLTFSGSALNKPEGIAIDASGNAWVTNFGATSISKLNPQGVIATTVKNNVFVNPYGIAIGPTGLVTFTAPNGPYVLNYDPSSGGVSGTNVGQTVMTRPGLDGSGNYYTGAYNSGSATSYMASSSNGGNYIVSVSGPLVNPYASAVDSNNYSWTTSQTTTSGSAPLFKLLNLNGYTSGSCTGTNYASGSGVAIDRGNNIWVSDPVTHYLIEFVQSGSGCAYLASYNGGGISTDDPIGISIDGNNNVWTLTQTHQRVIGITNAGASISGGSGYATGVTPGSSGLVGPVLDGSGNIWIANPSNNTISMMIGVATPVITPISQGVLQGALATKP